MYTHIGNGVVLKNKDIIGIFNMETIQNSRNNLRIQHELKERNLTGKSVILMESEKGKYIEDVSKVAVTTLQKRIERGIL